MRYLVGLMCVLALGVVGCSETTGNGGAAGDGGGMAACVDNVCSCSEEGIRAAISEGGGPFTFDCDGPATVETEAEIVIDKDVVLDGEGNLTIDANQAHRVFSVAGNITAELRGATVTGGGSPLPGGGGGIRNEGTLTLTNTTVSSNKANDGGGIVNEGTLTLSNSTVSQNEARAGGGIYSVGSVSLTNTVVSENTAGAGGGIHAGGVLTLTDSTVSGNTAEGCGGIITGGTATLTDSTVSKNTAERSGGICIFGTATLTNSTVSGNATHGTDSTIDTGSGIDNSGVLTLINSTVSGNTTPRGGSIYNSLGGTLTLTNTLVDGDCAAHQSAAITSGGYNIESPGDTCGFDTNKGDRVNVSAERLNLGELADNGGPTQTHALLPGSDAIDRIPTYDCIDYEQRLLTDQRGFRRDCACDVGAFEVQGGACPPGWACPPRNYGAADGCHCGCGVIDPDCADGTVASCDYCDGCGGDGCPGFIEPARNWECAA